MHTIRDVQERALSLPVPPRNTQIHKHLRSKIAVMSLVAERLHNKYGSVILIRDEPKVGNVYKRVKGTVELFTIV